MAVSQVSSNKLCQSCHREFSVFIRPHSCELCNQSKLCSNCARKFILSYQPNPTFLRLCNKCCEKISRGNQLKNSSKLSKNKAKNNSVWSFASSLIGSSKSSKQSKSIKLSSYSSPTSCIYCCSTQNKLNNADNIMYLHNTAPLFPDNYNLSTPQKRKEKQNIIFRHCIDSTNINIDDDNQQNININIDDENNCYRTMHPLNNLKLKPPKSILFNFEKTKSKNQFALNVSINRDETQYYIGNLDNTSLCDCFLQNDNNINNITDSCYCIIVYIKSNKIFKRLRIDLLFNESDEQYISMNVSLYDNKSQIWSGVSIVEINKIKPYKIISKIHVECNQTLIKKSVTITGSMSWIIDNNDIEYNNNYPYPYPYPYKGCNISQMISILTQQRFDIIDSYSTVIQQRNELNNLLKSDRKNQIHSNSIEQNENHKLYPSHQISQQDGGSNGKDTKRNISFKNENNRNKQNKECDNNISELEKSMFKHEIARIDSMILGLENTLYAIQNNTNNNKQKKMQFDEITSSVASSFMLHTNEINKQKLEIADHLHNDKNIQHIFNDKLTTNKKQNGICDNIEKNKSDVPLSNVMTTTKRMIPVCFLCQRCSRTIILCQKIEDP